MFIAIVAALICIVQVASLELNGTKFNYHNHSGKQREGVRWVLEGDATKKRRRDVNYNCGTVTPAATSCVF